MRVPFEHEHTSAARGRRETVRHRDSRRGPPIDRNYSRTLVLPHDEKHSGSVAKIAFLRN